MTERPLAVFDIDGVLADVTHRLHHLQRRPKNWHGFFADAIHDPPLADGLRLATEAARDCEVVYVTGRPEACRRDTVAWLRQHGLPQGTLSMRAQRDRRPAKLAKPQLLKRLAAGRTVAVVVDDDLAVCDAYEAAGWTVLRATWATRSSDLEQAQEAEGRT
jgi:phosphoglycolate phosphatase-like HAD superfamily hydrolase